MAINDPHGTGFVLFIIALTVLSVIVVWLLVWWIVGVPR